MAILPYLMAEQDRYISAKILSENKEEAEIMKNVPGWIVGESVYHGKRWLPPTPGL